MLELKTPTREVDPDVASQLRRGSILATIWFHIVQKVCDNNTYFVRLRWLSDSRRTFPANAIEDIIEANET